jgi:crossover junction endodeoxyribonuclease RuvC
MQKGEIILGIDPGTTIMGYAVLDVSGNEPALKTMDVLKLGSTKNIYSRLGQIHTKVSSLILTHHPTTFAIEAPFFGKNVQSMLKLGRAQGVAIAAAMQAQLLVTEYSPKKVKQSITGNGNADKEQIWKMLQQILKLRDQPKYFDATDALAVALCHYYQISSPVAQIAKGFSGWKDFVSKNPGRVSAKNI